VKYFTPLGLLNFVLLQWFGVRLARVYHLAGARIRPLDIPSGSVELEPIVTHRSWRVLRWIWPLTGWWSDYRWIARRP
jgi:hypothetical protein